HQLQRLLEVVGLLLRKADDERGRRLHAQRSGRAERGWYQLDCEALAGHPLHAWRSGLDAEEDAGTARVGHGAQQLVVHAIDPGAAAPAVATAGHRLTEGPDLALVDREQIVLQ